MCHAIVAVSMKDFRSWISSSPARVLVVFGVTLILSALYLYTALVVYPDHESAEFLHGAQVGVQAELLRLQEQGDELAKDPRIVDAIEARDRETLLPLLVSERERRGIGLMGAADSEGHILARTHTLSAYGDNVFLVAPLGRALAYGQQRGASVEASDVNPRQVFLTTGRWAYGDTGERVGALFSNALADDEFSQRFKERHVRNLAHVAFYTHAHGLYGSSFPPGEEYKLVASTCTKRACAACGL